VNEPLIVIRFKNATVTYLSSFEVQIDDNLWPRQLRATNEMIQVYKECSRDDSRNDKSNTTR
jgi:hypothetical protein